MILLPSNRDVSNPMLLEQPVTTTTEESFPRSCIGFMPL